MGITARQIEDALKNNESIATAIFALVDADEDAIRAHPEITVTEADGEIVSVTYDGNEFGWWGSEVSNGGYKLLSEWPAEVVCGFGRPLEITLTGGGPTEWIEARLDSDGDVSRAELRATYGDADRTWRLWETSGLYRLAAWFAETVRPRS